MIGLDASNAVRISAKRTGRRRPAGGDRRPTASAAGRRDGALKALLVDSWYDPYLGDGSAIKDGLLKKGMKIA